MIPTRTRPIGDPSKQPKSLKGLGARVAPPKIKKQPCEFCQKVRKTLRSFVFRG